LGGGAHAEKQVFSPNFTAWDIKAVWQRFRFLAEPNRDVLSLITALEKEAFYKGEDQLEKIGF